MPEDQKEIYYACGSSAEEIEKLPVMGKLRDKEYEVLYFLDERDEFVTQIMRDYDGKAFKSVNTSDLDLDTAEEKKEKEEKTEANKDMLEAMKDALNGNVKEVRISSRLKDDPVCIVADEGLSLDMERYMANDPMAKGQGMKAVKILEINPDHPVFARLQEVYAEDPSKLDDYADVLYNQALLIQGLPIADPVAYARKITDLMINSK
jgi:molecular chaperone HtpG